MTQCPQCKNQLLPVVQAPWNAMSPEKFQATKAGDWYCEHCKGEDTLSGVKYFWNRQLMPLPEPRVLRTVAEWTKFLSTLPDDARIFVDMNPITGGSFEYLRIAAVDHETRIVTAHITEHGE